MSETTSTIVTVELLTALRSAQPLTWHGIHGVAHWKRVCENGLRLAPLTGADASVVEYFAYLHDIKRLNDGRDPLHGPRAAAYVKTIYPALVHLDDAQLSLLVYACAHHTDGTTHEDVTICTCWDADRLDLARVNIIPDPSRLCTEAARDPLVIEWAVHRSRNGRDG